MAIQPTLNTSSVVSSLAPGTMNTNNIISLLMQVAQQPITNLTNQITRLQTNDGTYQNINSLLSTFSTAVNNLTDPLAFQASAATSSNTSVLTATSSTGATPGTYSIVVNNLASNTTATSTSGIGQPITSSNWGNTLSSMNLSTPVTAGTFSYTVDNNQFSYSLSDPTSTSLQTVLQAMASQIQTQVQATDSSATVSAAIVNNNVQFSISGATGNHTLTFGTGGDTSNFLTSVGLNAQTSSTFGTGGTTMTGTQPLGISNASSTLDQSNIAGLSLTNGGQFTINGVQISYDTGADTLQSVIGKINSSTAGVTATYDPTADKVTLSNKSGGAMAITMADNSGNLLQSLNLAPGTNSAQTLGKNASLTVNGSAISSPSNTISTAIPNVTLNLTGASTTPISLTVGTDTTGITTKINAFVTGFNNVIDAINSTQQKDPASGNYGALFNDPTLNEIQNTLYNDVSQMFSSLNPSGSPQSLQDIGITTGAPGAALGTTTHLQVDSTKLAAALQANPQAVANLFQANQAQNGVDGAGTMLSNYLSAMQGPNGFFMTEQQQSQQTVSSLNSQIADMQQNLLIYKQTLTSKFTAMNLALAQATQASQQLYASLGNASLLSGISPTTSSTGTTTGG